MSPGGEDEVKPDQPWLVKRERVRMNARSCNTLTIYRYFITDPGLNCNLRMSQTLTDLSSFRNWCQEIRAEDH